MRDVATVDRGEAVALHESEHVVRHGRFAGVANGRILVDNGMGVRAVPIGADFPHVTDTHRRVLGIPQPPPLE